MTVSRGGATLTGIALPRNCSPLLHPCSQTQPDMGGAHPPAARRSTRMPDRRAPRHETEARETPTMPRSTADFKSISIPLLSGLFGMYGNALRSIPDHQNGTEAFLKRDYSKEMHEECIKRR